MTDRENNENNDGLTDFGFESIPREDKKHRVRGVFDSVAERYDLIFDLAGSRPLERFSVAVRPGQRQHAHKLSRTIRAVAKVVINPRHRQIEISAAICLGPARGCAPCPPCG